MDPIKEKIILQLQKQPEPISSTRLAEQLHVSSRTIKNHIKGINQEQPNLVQATAKGYILNKQMSLPVPEETPAQSYEERFSYITHLFFVDHASSLNLYDLCDELYLSYSSMKQLISKVNQQYDAYDLSLKCKNDTIFLVGTERNKRRFLTQTLYKEAAGHFVDAAMLKTHFPEIDIAYLQTTMHNIFMKYNCYINDFGYTNLLLHITVILDRILNGNAFSETNGRQETVHPICEELIATFSTHFGVQFNPLERQNMNELITANINFMQRKDDETLKTIVGPQIFTLTHEIIDEINRRYHLQLNKETLLVPLSLHFKNLFYRSQQQTSLKNPLLETIQSSCPLLYDCAICITDYLDEHFNIQISPDETAYLAMHIGADLERQQKDIKKLKCALLCPDYQQNQQQIYNCLLIHFDSDIIIPTVVSFEEELEDKSYELLFTTVPVHANQGFTILLPPMISAMNLKEIYSQIQTVLDRKKMQILTEYYPQFFSPALFYLDKQADSRREDILKILCRKLRNEHFVSSHFLDEVLKREQAATTAFGQIAIPHSMKMDCEKTGLAIAISPAGIQWGTQRVHIVLLIAINEKDSHLFKELYEALILLFSDPSILEVLRQCKTFEEFTNVIFSYTM